MDPVVNEELKAYIDPLTEDEHQALERSLLAEGCRDALVLWGDVLVDGHNRYALCRKHGLPFRTVQNPRFRSIEDVHLWMIDQHLGRRSVSDFQRGVLALRKREIVAERNARHDAAAVPAASPAASPVASPAAEAAAASPSGNEADDLDHTVTREAFETREALARAARLSNSQFLMIEKIQRQAAPEVVAAVKAGTISINAAAAVASLPAQEQVAAAAAGRDELKLAARRVRESRRRPAAETTAVPEEAMSEDALRQRVTELTAENASLRQQVAQLQDSLQRARAGTASAAPAPASF
jgi:hypothetical protein